MVNVIRQQKAHFKISVCPYFGGSLYINMYQVIPSHIVDCSTRRRWCLHVTLPIMRLNHTPKLYRREGVKPHTCMHGLSYYQRRVMSFTMICGHTYQAISSKMKASIRNIYQDLTGHISPSNHLYRYNIDRMRQTDTQQGREAGKQAGRHTARQGGRQAGRQTHSKAGRQASRQAGRHTARQGGRQAGRQTHSKAGRQASRQADTQQGREAGKQAGRHTARQGGRQAERLTD